MHQPNSCYYGFLCCLYITVKHPGWTFTLATPCTCVFLFPLLASIFFYLWVNICFSVIEMLLKLSHVCVGGTHTLWMDTMWRSCAKLSGRLSRSRANPLASLPRHSRAKDSKVSVVVFTCWISFSELLCSLNLTETFISFSVDIEDLDNWHGKPIPKDMVDDLLKDLEAQIQVPNKTLSPELPIDDAAPADLSPISLLAPPAYKKGDKVSFCNKCFIVKVYSLSWWSYCLIRSSALDTF